MAAGIFGSGSSSIASYSTLSSMASVTAGKFIASHSRPAAASSGASGPPFRVVPELFQGWG
jgi:hypothetical protein